MSLGVDAAGADPESPLDVTTDGFAAAGELLAGLGRPTVLVHEGGYALDRLGPDTVAVLSAFSSSEGCVVEADLAAHLVQGRHDRDRLVQREHLALEPARAHATHHLGGLVAQPVPDARLVPALDRAVAAGQR